MIGPVRPKERIETLDVLRGFAIFGILIVNWAHDVHWSVAPWEGWTGAADQVTYWLIQFVANEKFWPFFSFLFGLGFAIQMERLEARGVAIPKLYSRRLLVLFVIGAAHFILAERDIVFMYAILGFLLLLMRKWPARTLVLVAVICVLIPWTLNTWQGWQHERRLADPATATEAVREAAQRQRAENLARWGQADPDRTMATGSFGEIVALRASWWWWEVSSWESYVNWLGDPFPPFLLGLYVGRRRIFGNVSAHRRFIRRVMWWSLAIGLIGTIAFMLLLAARDAPYLTRQGLKLLERFGSPSLAFFYICGLTLLLEKAAWKRRMQPLAAVGRMALTNYLLHSVAFVLLFFGYGLGVYGKVGAFGGFVLALPVLFLEVLLSLWWLKRFRFGPAEWLWRTLTYGKLQLMRVSHPAA